MSWIQTFTGVAVKPLDLQETDVKLRDIAHSLSLICRFNGHCRSLYTVGQHSLLCAREAPAGLELQVQLHDAAEYILQDIVRPLKAHLRIDDEDGLRSYSAQEVVALRTIYRALGARWPTPGEWRLIQTIDNRMVMTELRDLMADPPEAWGIDALPYSHLRIVSAPVEFVEAGFIDAYHRNLRAQSQEPLA